MFGSVSDLKMASTNKYFCNVLLSHLNFSIEIVTNSKRFYLSLVVHIDMDILCNHNIKLWVFEHYFSLGIYGNLILIIITSHILYSIN